MRGLSGLLLGPAVLGFLCVLIGLVRIPVCHPGILERTLQAGMSGFPPHRGLRPRVAEVNLSLPPKPVLSGLRGPLAQDPAQGNTPKWERSAACCEAERRRPRDWQNEEGRRTAGSGVRMPQPCRLPTSPQPAHPAWDQPLGRLAQALLLRAPRRLFLIWSAGLGVRKLLRSFSV